MVAKTKKARVDFDKPVQVQGKMWVSAHYPDGTDIGEETKLEIQTFDSEPAWVRAGYGVTINLGNYESARCDAGVTLPTYVEEIPEAFQKAWEIAENQVQEQVKEVRRR